MVKIRRFFLRRKDFHQLLLITAACSALLFNSIPLIAQTPSSYQLELRKDFISWGWDADLETTIKTGKNSEITFSNQFASNLYRQSSQTDKWRDENTLAIGWTQPISSVFQTRTMIRSRVFSDENTFVEFSKHLAAQELAIQVHPQIQLKPAIGWTMEEAFGIQDQGWYSHLGLDISKLDMGGYLNTSNLKSVLRSFPGRKNQEHTFYTGWSKEFSEYASDSLRVGYQFSESRYYISPRQTELSEENIQEQVIINSRFLFNQLHYQITDNSALAVITNFKNRDIDQSNPFLNNRRDELTLENQFQYLLNLGSFQLRTGLLFAQTGKDNPGVRTDINTLQSAINNSFFLHPSESDRIWGRFSYMKLEYNTPETFNNDIDRNTRDDRDEQRFVIETGYRHHFSPFFSLTLKGHVYLYHQIYLRSGRSANNNWNRIYQLGAQFDHKLSERIHHGHQLKILSNFTVFDFDEILTRTRSYVFRKLIYSDSLTIHLSDEMSLNNIYQWEKEDNGTFFKQSFTQQVTKDLSAHFISVTLNHNDVLGLTISTGISLFLRDEFNLVPEKRKVREFRSISPRLTVTYPARKKLMLYMTYAPNRTSDFGRDIQHFTSGNIKLQYNF